MDKALEILKNNLTSPVVVAVSGGPDSMVLLHTVLCLKKELDLKIIVAHVNHKHRIASEEEALMVKEYTEKNNMIFEYMEITEYTDDNFHNYAHEKRYEFFESLIKKYQAKTLLTAHHGDDLMETILMRIVRGSTLSGYAGLKMISNREGYIILRPFLEYTKDEIKAYADKHQIPYAIDESNNEDVYTRNRYRHKVLPFLKEEDKDVHLKFNKFSKLLLLYNDYIDDLVKDKIKNICPDNVICVDKFQKEPKIIKIKIIEYLLEQYYQSDLNVISDVHTKILYKTLMNTKSNVTINLPNGLIGIKNYNEFKIDYPIKKDSYNYEFTGYLCLPNKRVIKQITESVDNSNYEIKLDSQELKLPLYVRTRRDGDKIQVKGLNGHKKVKDILIDEKVKQSTRDSQPVVTDSTGEIIWLPGLKKSKFSKQNEEKYDIIIRYF